MSADEPPRQGVDDRLWMPLDSYLQTKPGQDAIAPARSSASLLLPSLNGSKGPAIAAPPVAEKNTLDFASMPPLFERRKQQPPMAAEKSAPPVVEKKPDIVVSSSDAEARKTPQASAIESDRATLDALRAAVKDLNLEKELDFMTAPKTKPAQNPPAAGTP